MQKLQKSQTKKIPQDSRQEKNSKKRNIKQLGNYIIMPWLSKLKVDCKQLEQLKKCPEQ